MSSPMKPPDMPDDLQWGAPGEMTEGIPFDAAGEMPEIDPAILGGGMPFPGMTGAPEGVPFSEMPQKMSARPRTRWSAAGNVATGRDADFAGDAAPDL